MDMMDIKERQFGSRAEEAVLEALAQSAAREGALFLEVGSWCGQSTVILGKVAQKKGGRLYCVDWWKGSKGTELEGVAAAHDVFKVFRERIAREGLEETVIPVVGDSKIALTAFKPGYFDLVFIDGDHRHSGVAQDIENGTTLVRSDGGVLCGHDCEGRLTDFEPEKIQMGRDADVFEGLHCGVILAVGERFRDYSIDFNVWSVRRTGNEWKRTAVDIGDKTVFLETYKDYNLFLKNGLITGLEKSFGTSALERAVPGLRARLEEANLLLNGSTFKEVKAKIDASTPDLVEDGFGDYNIVFYRNNFYAVSRAIGELNLSRTSARLLEFYRDAGLIFVNADLGLLKQETLKTEAGLNGR